MDEYLNLDTKKMKKDRIVVIAMIAVAFVLTVFIPLQVLLSAITLPLWLKGILALIVGFCGGFGWAYAFLTWVSPHIRSIYWQDTFEVWLRFLGVNLIRVPLVKDLGPAGNKTYAIYYWRIITLHA